MAEKYLERVDVSIEAVGISIEVVVAFGWVGMLVVNDMGLFSDLG
jgi:hypothetical protein